ncbi:hypothetical protein MF271_12030 [Deinococcus sp. KNUC1210]|uniref:hypothetical protein n=1 Tax=Deinococcus sp. KNUC1210 TaxID=2917691 RepID=UPI001EF04D77|nr:hypothetical protein [Deinococcus sp. KNUC1210]ULH14724.1 hypothetical protein MF271_12030 [Deinococcus sp. KNUC1210]
MRRVLLLLGLLAGTAQAADVDTLLSALKKSLVAEARGTAVVEVAFPPSKNPVRQARLLPRLGAVPALIRRNFTVTLEGQEVLAGRTALRYSLVARNTQAAPWTIWVDSVWNVPLAYQEQRQEGTLARRAAFLTVNAAPARLKTPLSVRVPDPALKKRCWRPCRD